jgi:hypothetical protein
MKLYHIIFYDDSVTYLFAENTQQAGEFGNRIARYKQKHGQGFHKVYMISICE